MKAGTLWLRRLLREAEHGETGVPGSEESTSRCVMERHRSLGSSMTFRCCGGNESLE